MPENGNDLDKTYTYCPDSVSTRKALRVLRACSAVVFDTEGEKLGEPDGTLSIMLFRTTGQDPDRSFIIDVLKLEGAACSEVLQFLAAPTPVKVVFDGRMDFTDLFYRFHISAPNHPSGILDLQLVDIHSRKLRGETRWERLSRLLRLVKIGGIKQKPSSNVDYVELLHSLEGSLMEHKIIASRAKEKLDHSQWLVRPIPNNYMVYAATDVALIELLFNQFLKLGFVNQVNYVALMDVSANYVSIWCEGGRLPRDEYRGHPLLPMGVLVHSSMKPGKLSEGIVQVHNSQTKYCDGCKRNIPTLKRGTFCGERCANCHILQWRYPAKKASNQAESGTTPKGAVKQAGDKKPKMGGSMQGGIQLSKGDKNPGQTARKGAEAKNVQPRA